jgi:predicted RNase H-like nuclease
MHVVGVDGWRGGWVGVALSGAGVREVWIAEDASRLVARAAGAAVVGIDVPIGLPRSTPRTCDTEARKLLGHRRSSVFPVPPRSVIELEPYAEANAHCKERFGFGVSRQSYALRSKILDVDTLEDERLHEVHPELAFQTMTGRALPHKKTWAGVSARRAALAGAGIGIADGIGEAGVVPVDDVLDAAAAAWTARRILQGDAGFVPATPEFDERGKPMTIWF